MCKTKKGLVSILINEEIWYNDETYGTIEEAEKALDDLLSDPYKIDNNEIGTGDTITIMQEVKQYTIEGPTYTRK